MEEKNELQGNQNHPRSRRKPHSLFGNINSYGIHEVDGLKSLAYSSRYNRKKNI